MKLTVYCDGQFWVGVLEEVVGSQLKTCRYIFGLEPSDTTVMDFVIFRSRELLREDPEAVVGKHPSLMVNPKDLT
jgi:hypothetical protein